MFRAGEVRVEARLVHALDPADGAEEGRGGLGGQLGEGHAAMRAAPHVEVVRILVQAVNLEWHESKTAICGKSGLLTDLKASKQPGRGCRSIASSSPRSALRPPLPDRCSTGRPAELEGVGKTFLFSYVTDRRVFLEVLAHLFLLQMLLLLVFFILLPLFLSFPGNVQASYYVESGIVSPVGMTSAWGQLLPFLLLGMILPLCMTRAAIISGTC